MNEYFHRMATCKPLIELQNERLIRIDKESLGIEFAQSIDGSVAVDNLYLDINDEGGLVVKFAGERFVFYLAHFGDINRIETTVDELVFIVRCIFDSNKKRAAYLIRFGQSKAIRLKDSEAGNIESSIVYSNNIINNILLFLYLRARSEDVLISLEKSKIKKF